MNEQELTALLRELSARASVPATDAMEQRLLRAFADAHPRVPSRRAGALVAWWPAAALVMLSTGLVGHLATTARAPEFAAPLAEFVALPGTGSLPDFESGRILRIEVPIAALPAYGLDVMPDAVRAAVEADLLIGQDGVPRAIRLAASDAIDRSR